MATTTETSPTLVTDEFRAAFRGTLFEPGDPGYDDARAVYNGMIDRRPRLVARCHDSADVIAAVGLARDTGTTLAVSAPGQGVIFQNTGRVVYNWDESDVVATAGPQAMIEDFDGAIEAVCAAFGA